MTKLARVLGLRDLTLLTIGSVIGSGIFLVPGEVLRQAGGQVGPAMLVWLVGGLLSLLGALTYGELSAVNPKAGGIYVHLRDCFGPLPAFLFGWTLFFAMNGGTVATLAVAFSTTLSTMIPLSPAMSKTIAIAMIAILTIVNVKGTRESADLQNWTTGIKVGAILVMSVVLLALGRGFTSSSEAIWPAAFSGSLASGFGLAMIGVLWAYEGWQYPTFSAGEVVNPQRNYPRAFLVGTAALIGIYLIANLSYIAALAPAGVANSTSVAAESLTLLINPTAAKLIAITILVSVFSAANSNVLTCPRVYYAMANDGLFFHKLAEVHPRFGTPAFAIVAGSAWAAILAIGGTFTELFTYVVFSGWIFYGLCAATIFVYRRRLGSAQLTYKVPGYPWTPLIFIAAAFILVANTLVNNLRDNPAKTGLAVGIIALGLPAYLIWHAKSRSSKPASVSTEEI
ncbi:MAG TPA: amino acid permease [Blastocatellia bacterium]|nr:amino acid permease [Blastocatellia bacterium]